MESRVRSIMKEESNHLEQLFDSRLRALDQKLDERSDSTDRRLDSLDEKLDARFETLEVKIDALEQRLPFIQDLADIKARLSVLEKSRN